jgi:peptidoglycan/xylan/chitin deacetylase (PgdA/CDA1 family)
MFDFPQVRTSRRTMSEGSWRQGTAQWPDSARCIVAITVDFDGRSNEAGKGLAPVGIHSAGRYSARRGVHRHLDMFERLGIPVTFFVPGYDARTAPGVVLDIARAGHEIGAHGYKHEGTLLPAAEESHDILSDLTGTAPVGWRSPSGQKTDTTLRVLGELGYRYDSSDKDFDMPYFLKLGTGGTFVEIPNNTLSLNDTPWYNVSMTPSSAVEAQWKAEFDAIYADRGFFLLTCHPRAGFGSGTPARARCIEGLIRHIRSHRNVRFMRLGEIDEWVRGNADAFEEVAI